MSRYKNIRALFSDIDGTLTDGRLYYGPSGEALKVFHVKDGDAIKRWMKSGRLFGVISARKSPIIEVRMNELGVQNVALGQGDKVSYMEEWLNTHNLDWNSLAYIGDDLNDIPVMKKCALAAAPSDAAAPVIQTAAFHCTTPGGLGALREFVDNLLENV